MFWKFISVALFNIRKGNAVKPTVKIAASLTSSMTFKFANKTSFMDLNGPKKRNSHRKPSLLWEGRTDAYCPSHFHLRHRSFTLTTEQQHRSPPVVPQRSLKKQYLWKIALPLIIKAASCMPGNVPQCSSHLCYNVNIWTAPYEYKLLGIFKPFAGVTLIFWIFLWHRSPTCFPGR